MSIVTDHYRRLERGARRSAQCNVATSIAFFIVAILYAVGQRWGFAILWTLMAPVWLYGAFMHWTTSRTYGEIARAQEEREVLS